MNSNYNPFQFLFYPMILALLSVGIYFVYKSNPALMDQLSLIEKQKKSKKSEIFVVQSPSAKQGELLTEDLSAQMLSYRNDKSHPASLRVDHRFDFYKEGPLVEKNAHWFVDGEGLIINTKNKLDIYNNKGEVLWSLTNEEQLCPGPISANKKILISCKQDGGLNIFTRDKGRLVWSRNDQKKYIKNPVLINGFIYTFEASSEGKWALGKTELKTGSEIGLLKDLSLEHLSPLAFSQSKELMVLVEKSGNVRAYNLKTMKPHWKSDVSGKFSAPAALGNESAYVITPEGMIYALSLSNGEMLWDYSINKASHQSITIAEGLGIGAVTDDDGYLHMLDIRAGKRKWRFNTGTKSKNHEMVAIRLKNENAQKLNMGSESQGWLFWGPCKDSEICAFEPFKGLLVRRIDPGAGKILFPPQYMGNSQMMVVLVQDKGSNQFKIYADRDFINKQKESDAVDKMESAN